MKHWYTWWFYKQFTKNVCVTNQQLLSVKCHVGFVVIELACICQHKERSLNETKQRKPFSVLELRVFSIYITKCHSNLKSLIIPKSLRKKCRIDSPPIVVRWCHDLQVVHLRANKIHKLGRASLYLPNMFSQIKENGNSIDARRCDTYRLINAVNPENECLAMDLILFWYNHLTKKKRKYCSF